MGFRPIQQGLHFLVLLQLLTDVVVPKSIIIVVEVYW